MSLPLARRKRLYAVGQVVAIDIPFYNTKEKMKEKYQCIVDVWPWGGSYGGFGLTFANGDKCHQFHVRPLTQKEKGRGNQ